MVDSFVARRFDALHPDIENAIQDVLFPTLVFVLFLDVWFLRLVQLPPYLKLVHSELPVTFLAKLAYAAAMELSHYVPLVTAGVMLEIAAEFVVYFVAAG